ncbi:hypothetical protein PMIN06_008722 [Paraphaeosphaeria minitans]|uniref:Yippee family protein n=1 Tax=Paraphaeosphaeria minitans TaxID=565426 RepID=A0A9P6GDB3_9PLEO|nr:Yippee family protein [Paraphaeosphaeria minitans]
MPILTHNPPVPFPLYLLPSLPFRRRRSSTTTTSSTPSSSPPQPTSYLSSTTTSHLRCAKCLADLIPTSSIISKGFTGRHGRAYLVSPPPPSSLYPSNPASKAIGYEDGELITGDLPNTHVHKAIPRQLVTGAHTVSDISCRLCGSVLGWKYVEAEEEAQRYKVGKYILETKRVVRGAGWEGGGGRDDEAVKEEVLDDDVEFDSQDEEECEDLFTGVWTARGAAVRRRRRQSKF